MGAFIKTMLAMYAAHVACHPGLLCHASWSVRLPCAAWGPALLKPFVILFSENPGTGIYSRLCSGSDCAGYVPGAKLNLFYCLITSYKNGFALFSFKFECGILSWTAVTNANMCVCTWMEFAQRVIYSTARREEGTSAPRWKKASDEDSLMFLGLVLMCFISACK